MESEMILIEKQGIADREMIEVSLEYWFKDHETHKSPFPDYIKNDLRKNAIAKYWEWLSRLKEEAKKEIGEEILVEKFEEVLFEEATALVKLEDEKLTIKYPFMIRIGDTVQDQNKPESKVIERSIDKKGDEVFLKVRLKELATGNEWDTSFELPE